MLKESLLKELSGMKDSRGMKGIISRGANVYNGGSSRAHAGKGVSGRPKKRAIGRRLGRF